MKLYTIRSLQTDMEKIINDKCFLEMKPLYTTITKDVYYKDSNNELYELISVAEFNIEQFIYS